MKHEELFVLIASICLTSYVRDTKDGSRNQYILTYFAKRY